MVLEFTKTQDDAKRQTPTVVARKSHPPNLIMVDTLPLLTQMSGESDLNSNVLDQTVAIDNL